MGGRTLHSGITQVSYKKNSQVLKTASWKQLFVTAVKICFQTYSFFQDSLPSSRVLAFGGKFLGAGECFENATEIKENPQKSIVYKRQHRKHSEMENHRLLTLRNDSYYLCIL